MPHTIPPLAEALMRSVLGPLRRYHRFQVKGLDNLPAEGPAMLVMHHTLATYDAFLIGRAVLEHSGRQALGLGDDNLFKIPGLRTLCHDLGIRPAAADTAEKILAGGDLLFLAPGGTREALRPHTQRYQPVWHDRKGFARLAMKMQVPVLLAGCPAGDRIFKVYNSRITRSFYERTRWPVPILRGVGPTLLPRRVVLTGYISTPIEPPKASPDDEDALNAFHAELTARMTKLLEQR